MTQTTNSTPSLTFTPAHPTFPPTHAIAALVESLGLHITYVREPFTIAHVFGNEIRLDARSPVCEATDAILRLLAGETSAKRLPRGMHTAAECLAIVQDGNGSGLTWDNVTASDVAGGLLFARLGSARLAANVAATVVQEVCECMPNLITSHMELVVRTARTIEKLTNEEHTAAELRTAYWVLSEVLETGEEDDLPEILNLMVATLHRCFDAEALYKPAEVGIFLVGDLSHGMPDAAAALVETIRQHVEGTLTPEEQS